MGSYKTTKCENRIIKTKRLKHITLCIFICDVVLLYWHASINVSYVKLLPLFNLSDFSADVFKLAHKIK